MVKRKLSDCLFTEYNYIDEDGDSNMPIITLEVMSPTNTEQSSNVQNEVQTNASEEPTIDDTGVHFLTDTTPEEPTKPETDKEESKEPPKARTDLLEYFMRNDGSVICKLCGEILQSRTHWYRHKYKLHVIHPLNPAPLFQCEQCLVYFKSRKGYIGHLASRHSDILSDSNPVVTNSQAETIAKETPPLPEVKEEPDPELSIPMTSVPNYQTTVVKHTSAKTELKKITKVAETSTSTTSDRNWDEKRTREEKLVADIIDRVRRECEAQGSGSAARRGYSRRTTVMHTT